VTGVYKFRVGVRRSGSTDTITCSSTTTANRQEPSEVLATKITGLRDKIAKLGDEMRRLADLEARMLESPGRAQTRGHLT
jgi:hypothetical protein